MINFMVANFGGKRYPDERLTNLVNAQIENSLDLGWNEKNIVLLSNISYNYMGIETKKAELNSFCWTGSKMFALRAFINESEDDIIWAHDLDAWQNAAFTEPVFKDVGIAQYSTSKYNGGSVFWRKASSDIVNEICRRIEKDNLKIEEPTLNEVLKSKDYRDRITVLDNTFNVGCSGFVKRYFRSTKPIRILHFHPDNRIAWETHALDRNQVGEIAVSKRLKNILKKYYTLADKLNMSEEDKELKRKKYASYIKESSVMKDP